MKNIKKGVSNLIFFCLPGAFITIIPLVAASCLLRNLGAIVGAFVQADEGDKFDFANIFSQTQDAELSLHVLIPLMLGILFLAIRFFLISKIKTKIYRVSLTCILFLVFLLIAVICSLLMTRVNGIRFVELLEKLLPLIDKL